MTKVDKYLEKLCTDNFVSTAKFYVEIRVKTYWGKLFLINLWLGLSYIFK